MEIENPPVMLCDEVTAIVVFLDDSSIIVMLAVHTYSPLSLALSRFDMFRVFMNDVELFAIKSVVILESFVLDRG